MLRVGWILALGLWLSWCSATTYGQNGVVDRSPTIAADLAPMAFALNATGEAAQGGDVQPSEPTPDAAACCDAPSPQPWKLPQPCVLQHWGINVGGWVQQGLTFNADNPRDRFNGPVTTNDQSQQYQLNQAWVYFVKPTKTDGCGFDIGGRVDVVYGSDWRFGMNQGLENRINGSDNLYGLILPQFYLELAFNDLTVKLGHFATMTSYEVVPAPANFFYSHSYLMAGYFDPLLVTGLQAEYKLGDNWTLIGGFNRGWMMFEDPAGDMNFLGGVKWVSDDKRTTLSSMVDAGSQVGFTGNNDRTSWINVFTYQLNECWNYAAQYTVGQELNGSTVNLGSTAHWYGTDQYLFYKLNPQWSTGLRYEWVRDEDGSRIAGIGNRPETTYGWLGKPGFTGSFHALSLGLNYRPHPNFVFRPEVRWDGYDGPTNLAKQLPFNDGSKCSQFTTAMDLIVTF